MTWIKICGTTNLEDALMCAEAGADALGFVFAESPRKIDAVTAAKITASLPANIEKVGVFVDEAIERVAEISKSVRLDAIQLHGNEDADYVRELRKRISGRIIQTVLKRIPKPPLATALTDLLHGYGMGLPLGSHEEIYAWLYDSKRDGLPGGTGIKWDWKDGGTGFEMSQKRGLRCIVAGGLTPKNVDEAIRILHPWGVDVVSGVERAPGKKDPAKIKAFIRTVREADRGKV